MPIYCINRPHACGTNPGSQSGFPVDLFVSPGTVASLPRSLNYSRRWAASKGDTNLCVVYPLLSGQGCFVRSTGRFVSRFDARRFQGTIVAKMSGFGASLHIENRHGLMTVFLIFDEEVSFNNSKPTAMDGHGFGLCSARLCEIRVGSGM